LHDKLLRQSILTTILKDDGTNKFTYCDLLKEAEKQSEFIAIPSLLKKITRQRKEIEVWH
jgi:hypothetical protein